VAFLIGMSEGLRGQKFEIKTDRTTIGRALTNDIVINDAAASAQHCYISRRGDRYVLHDMNSTNGTCLNFERINEAELHPKQVIQIGSSELMFDGDATYKTPLTAAIPANANVVADVAPPNVNPKSFSSVSPFGARRRDNKNAWMAVIVIVGILALVAMVYFVTQMLK
jgi:pSer/pThr/pTyr-binding forkhead associated (FHA) protein